MCVLEAQILELLFQSLQFVPHILFHTEGARRTHSQLLTGTERNIGSGEMEQQGYEEGEQVGVELLLS